MSPTISSDDDNNNNTNRYKGKSRKSTKFALLAGILAIGILAAALVSAPRMSQTLNAMAQTAPTTTNDSKSTNNSSSNSIYANMDGFNRTYNYHNPEPTVSTSGTATTKVKPDKFSVTVGVETNGTTAQEATSRNADLMARVISALKALGITDSQISTTNYNVYPVYESRDPGKMCIQTYPLPPDCQPSQVITGYRASNTLTVTLDVQPQGGIDAGKIIDASIKAGANNVNGVSFFISPEKQQKIRDALIKDALLNAKHRAQVAADALDMTVSGVQSISLNDVYFPIYSKTYDRGLMTTGAEAGAPTPIMPGEQDISTTVSAVFYISGGNSTTNTTPGMLKTNDTTNCTNPPNGPMIC